MKSNAIQAAIEALIVANELDVAAHLAHKLPKRRRQQMIAAIVRAI